MPVSPRLRYLLRRHIDDSSTKAELQELYDMLPEVRNESLDDLLDEEYEVIRQIGNKPDVDWDGLFNRVVTRTPVTVKRRSFRWWQYAAAAVVLGIAGTAYLYMQPKSQSAPDEQLAQAKIIPAHAGALLTLSNGQQIVLDSAADGTLTSQGGTRLSKVNGRLVYAAANGLATEMVYNTISTPRGRFFQLELPDGTKVWLNALSSLQYPNIFKGNERVVTLTGEGYFDVTRDASKPFRVRANGHTVEVLGTGFNVQAYTPVMITTLIEGAVSVSNGHGQRIPLKPGQQALADGNTIRVNTADTKKAVAWKDGEFRFRSDDMMNIMNQLSHWYNIDVRYAGQVPAKTYSGSISRQAKIEEVLEMLQVLTGAHFGLDGTIVTVSF